MREDSLSFSSAGGSREEVVDTNLALHAAFLTHLAGGHLNCPLEMLPYHALPP